LAAVIRAKDYPHFRRTGTKNATCIRIYENPLQAKFAELLFHAFG
jgi:hypothetical protein